MLELNHSTYDLTKLRIPDKFKEAIYIASLNLWKNREKLKIKYLYLFGSCSKEAVDSNSDIDILLLTDASTEREVRLELYDVHDEEDKINGIKVQVTVRCVDSFINEELDTTGFNQEVYNSMKLIKGEFNCGL